LGAYFLGMNCAVSDAGKEKAPLEGRLFLGNEDILPIGALLDAFKVMRSSNSAGACF
jgi:hypothetical protein